MALLYDLHWSVGIAVAFVVVEFAVAVSVALFCIRRKSTW